MNEKFAVHITGLGQLSALGQGLAALKQGLAGELKPITKSRTTQTHEGAREVQLFVAPEVNLPSDIPESIKRRMSRISRMFFASTLEALEDSYGLGFVQLRKQPTRTGLVLGTAFGCLDLANAYERRIILEGPTGASPSLFASSIQNAIASQLAISFDIQGPVSTVTTMEQTSVGCFRLAYDWIQSGVADNVVVTLGDEISDYHPYALSQRRISQELLPKSNRCTAIAGEGTVSFILSRQNLAPRNYARIHEVQIFAEKCPPAARHYAAAYGAENQWARYLDWSQTGLDCHAELYGSVINGLGFEAAIAAIQIERDGLRTACVQLSDHHEAQALVLIKSE